MEEIDIEKVLAEFRCIYVIQNNVLIPDKKSTFNKTLSTTYGCSSFPYHTDGAHYILPPRWIILQYKGNASSRFATLFYDTMLIDRTEFDDILHRHMYKVNSKEGVFLTTVINNAIWSEPIVRWNKLLMKKIYGERSLDFDDLITSPSLRVEWTKGKTVIFDNWRLLHAREEVGFEERETRIIERFSLTPKKR